MKTRNKLLVALSLVLATVFGLAAPASADGTLSTSTSWGDWHPYAARAAR